MRGRPPGQAPRRVRGRYRMATLNELEETMGYLVGAYAIAPASLEAEDALLAGLAARADVRGLELPFTGALHRSDERWLLARLRPDWEHVVTLIPGTMGRLQADKAFGLASADEAGRQAALAMARDARAAVARLNEAAGRAAVIAVEVHSAPSRGPAGGVGSAEAFARSLAEIAAWDWFGARIVVEHCDAHRPGHPQHKGFLSVDDELAAIERANDRANDRANASARRPIGVNINWGRSVLETHDAGAAVAHVEAACRAGALSGLMFSGASGADTPWGVWQDTHMPQAPAAGLQHGAEGSLMTEAEIARTLAAARGAALDFVGAKIAIRPPEAGVEARLGLVGDLLAMLARAGA
jgi:hypothetical protein